MSPELIIVPSLFLMLAYITYVIVDGYRRRQQIRLATEFHGRLLDRIGSAKEFGEFLSTSGGVKFLESLTIQREGRAELGILRALQTGLVLVVLGIGLFIFVSEVALNYFAPEGIAFLATVATTIGLGLLLSAGASYGLSRHMGLLNDGHRRQSAPEHSA